MWKKKSYFAFLFWDYHGRPRRNVFLKLRRLLGMLFGMKQVKTRSTKNWPEPERHKKGMSEYVPYHRHRPWNIGLRFGHKRKASLGNQGCVNLDRNFHLPPNRPNQCIRHGHVFAKSEAMHTGWRGINAKLAHETLIAHITLNYSCTHAYAHW